MIKKSLFFFLLSPVFCYSFQESPWFENCFQFHFIPQYSYDFFKKVDHAKPQIKYTEQTHLLNLGLDFTGPETWNFETELECADTTTVSFGYRSFGLQVRKLWLDDVCGDFISLTTGLSYRDASKRMRRALSTPYHARSNFEFLVAFGKEWNCGCYWTFRSFKTFVVGQGNRHSPWVRSDMYLMWNLEDRHQFMLGLMGYIGLGNRKIVHTNDFHGWGNIQHRSIDIGGSYTFSLGIWGHMQFDYWHRVFAQSYPEHVNTFLFTFDFPFSMF